VQELLQQAITLAVAAGKEAMKVYAKDFTVQEKEDRSPVTEGDLASEAVILTGLKKTGLAILSEETKASPSWFLKDKVWIVDPIDGTMDFIQKTGEFSIMIGLVVNKEPVLGVVYQPTEELCYFASKGRGAFIQKGADEKTRISVSDIADFQTSRVILSRNHTSDKQEEFIKKHGFGNAKHIGSAGLKIGAVASGGAEVYFTESNKIHQWDTAAGEIILKEAGGVVTDLLGHPLVYCQKKTNHPNGILACNRALQQKMLLHLRESF